MLWGHYGVMLAEYLCLRPTTQLHSPLKAYKALGTPLQLHGNVVIVRQPLKLPIGSVLGNLATVGFVGPLRCDASRVVMP